MSTRTAVIAGGGPVGAVAAIMLARQGWTVQVFERASLPTVRPSQQDQRAYRLNVTSRGLHVLKIAKVNIDSIIATQGKLLEATFHKANGQVLMHAKMPMTQDPQCVKAFRDEVALCCIKEAQHLYPQAISFHFDTPITQVDLHRQTVHTASAGPDSTQEVPYDLLVGADGAGSVVRSALQQIMPPHYVRRYRHGQMYSMMNITPSDPGQIAPHAVSQAHPIKEGVVLWDARGSNDCRVGLAVPTHYADALRQGDTDKVVQMLNESAPSLPAYARKAVMELVHSRPEFYPMPSWTHLSQLHGPRTVLLGDAAHTMTPALGQGLNSGLEDAAVFAHCLERHQGNVDATLPAYNKLRLPDVQAILTINEVVSTNDVGLRMLNQDAVHRLWVSSHKILLILHMLLNTVLHKAAPRVFGGPRLLQVVVGKAPYRQFMSTIYKDGILFAGILAAVTTFALHMI